VTDPAVPPPLAADRLLGSLVRDGVDFVVVGGFAVIAHGVVRATRDVDIVVRPTPPNYRALSACLTRGRLSPSVSLWESQFLDLDLADAFDLARGAVYRLSTPHGWLDVLNRMPAVPRYDDLKDASVSATVDAVDVRFASVDDLIAMKLAADRPRDRLDVAELLAIRRIEGDGPPSGGPGGGPRRP
jgi:hypothetical protein